MRVVKHTITTAATCGRVPTELFYLAPVLFIEPFCPAHREPRVPSATAVTVVVVVFAPLRLTDGDWCLLCVDGTGTVAYVITKYYYYCYFILFSSDI